MKKYLPIFCCLLGLVGNHGAADPLGVPIVLESPLPKSITVTLPTNLDPGCKKKCNCSCVDDATNTVPNPCFERGTGNPVQCPLVKEVNCQMDCALVAQTTGVAVIGHPERGPGNLCSTSGPSSGGGHVDCIDDPNSPKKQPPLKFEILTQKTDAK